MIRAIASPVLNKTNPKVDKCSKGISKKRSTLAEEIFRNRARLTEPSVRQKKLLNPKSPKFDRAALKSTTKQQVLPHYNKHRRHEGENHPVELEPAKANASIVRHEPDEDEITTKSGSEADDSDEEDEQVWLDGSTLIAPYQDILQPHILLRESETEEDRAIALVEYLQVPLQEKSHELKQDLCKALTASIHDIRQAHVKVDGGADVDRGKGIVHFNDACDQRHIEASRVEAQLKDIMTENQNEINKLFVQLKQAYDTRRALWVDLQVRIDEITDLQAGVLDQLDDNMARVVAASEKKCKAMMKDNSFKDQEKLLRGVLRKL